jgi:hypothetical protein
VFVLDLSLRRNLLKTILLVIPLSSENLSSLLSPVLGQYGLDISTFIESFLVQVRFYREELNMRVFLTLFSDNTFSFFIIPISYNFLVRALLLKTDLKNISIYEMYKLVHFYSLCLNRFDSLFSKNCYLNLRGYLTSFNAVLPE